MQKNRNVVVCLLPLLLSACSVGMAVNGEKTPDISVVRQGATQSEIELQFGIPVKAVNNPNGTKTCVYDYSVGNESSPGRAIGHGVMDVLTLGIWEVVGTPVEAAAKGARYQLAVTYDANNRMIDVKRSNKGEEIQLNS